MLNYWVIDEESLWKKLKNVYALGSNHRKLMHRNESS